jgi:hypothetical protein
MIAALVLLGAVCFTLVAAAFCTSTPCRLSVEIRCSRASIFSLTDGVFIKLLTRNLSQFELCLPCSN